MSTNNDTEHSGPDVRQSCPALVIMLIDQSASMADPDPSSKGSESKAQRLAAIANNWIGGTLSMCILNGNYVNRAKLVVVGYGGFGSESQATARVLESGWAAQLDPSKQRTEWIKPASSGGTQMAKAFSLALDQISAWPDEFKDRDDKSVILDNCVPPVIINITDGKANDFETAVASQENQAKRIREIETPTSKIVQKLLNSFENRWGKAIILNAQLADGAQEEVLFPDAETMLDGFGQFLFSISSELPEWMQRRANDFGYNVKKGARALAVNAAMPAVEKLITFGSVHLR